MSIAALLAVAITGIWLSLAVLVVRRNGRGRGSAVVLLVLAGVPLLGWLTLKWGPGPGVLCLMLGLAALLLSSQKTRDTGRQ
ncbi:MAG: DUF2484 family protein [Paracoccus sp. (in: a-proteobacteria)]|nr:DUF2484 family protein [Paracoccus sp. (in: a-proteobacteria)]